MRRYFSVARSRGRVCTIGRETGEDGAYWKIEGPGKYFKAPRARISWEGLNSSLGPVNVEFVLFIERLLSSSPLLDILFHGTGERCAREYSLVLLSYLTAFETSSFLFYYTDPSSRTIWI